MNDMLESEFESGEGKLLSVSNPIQSIQFLKTVKTDSTAIKRNIKIDRYIDRLLYIYIDT